MSLVLQHRTHITTGLRSPYGLLKGPATTGLSDTSSRDIASCNITLIESVQKQSIQSREGYGDRVQELQGIMISSAAMTYLRLTLSFCRQRGRQHRAVG